MLMDWIERIEIDPKSIRIELKSSDPFGRLAADTVLTTPAVKIRSGGESRIVVGSKAEDGGYPNQRLIALVADAFVVRERIVSGESIASIAVERGQTPQWIGKLVRLGWLSPALIESILDGQQPQSLTCRKLCQLKLSAGDLDAIAQSI